jgi:hypothetical protein
MSMSQPPESRIVKIGDILPSLASFDSVLSSLKSYRLWPVVIREALLDRAISGITCSEEDNAEAWGIWCRRNEVDPDAPIFEGLSIGEMHRAARRERQIDKFKEGTFSKLLPEYFRKRKSELDRVHLELAQFHHLPLAEEALFRCRGGEQTLETAALELAHREGTEPALKKIGPVAIGRLSAGLVTLLAGTKSGELLGPKKIGQFYVVVRVLELTEVALEGRTRQRLLDELLNQWVEQQISAMTGRPSRPVIQEI